MKKLNLILDQSNWLEATWTENDIVIWCESYSGHLEHIEMLRNKAKKMGTSLKDYESIIKKCKDNFIYPTNEEVLENTRQSKLAEIQSIYEAKKTESVEFNGNFYKGGDESASAIAGAVTLAKGLGEKEVKIIDSSDNPNIMTLDEALLLSGKIAYTWREIFFRYKELKVLISQATSEDDLNKVVW